MNMTAWKTETGFNEMHTVLIISQDMEMAAVCEGLFKQKNCYVVHEATAYHALQTTRLLVPSFYFAIMEKWGKYVPRSTPRASPWQVAHARGLTMSSQHLQAQAGTGHSARPFRRSNSARQVVSP